METYDQNAGAGIAIGMMIFAFVIGIAFYLFFGYCMKLIAEKTGHTENSWWAWIPIMNILLLLQVAGKEAWWIVLFLIPGVNIIVSIIVWMEVAKARGKENWWGIIAALFAIIGIPYLAFSDSEAAV